MSALDPIGSLLRILHSNDDPRQAAMGMALGMVAGLTPLFSLHNLVVLLLLCILRINLASLLFSLGIFSAFAYLLDPLSHQLGLTVLQLSSLQGLWTEMYNNAFWRLTNFNNTIVLGSLIIALLLFYPLYRLLAWAIVRYRERAMVYIKKWRLEKLFKLIFGIKLLGRNT